MCEASCETAPAAREAREKMPAAAEWTEEAEAAGAVWAGGWWDRADFTAVSGDEGDPTTAGGWDGWGWEPAGSPPPSPLGSSVWLDACGGEA